MSLESLSFTHFFENLECLPNLSRESPHGLLHRLGPRRHRQEHPIGFAVVAGEFLILGERQAALLSGNAQLPECEHRAKHIWFKVIQGVVVEAGDQLLELVDIRAKLLNGFTNLRRGLLNLISTKMERMEHLGGTGSRIAATLGPTTSH